jgi:hypothetical protein
MAKQESTEHITKTTIRVPTALWKRVRTQAIQDGISAEALVVAALSAYLRKGGK